MKEGKLYALAPKAKLIKIIANLVHALGRPICSADIRQYFALHPEERTDHIRPWGAVLAHLARRRPDPVPYLRAYGRIGRTYYALETTQGLTAAFQAERRRLRIVQARGWRMADHVELLLGTEFEKAGQMAAAGFIQEFRPWREHSKPLATELNRLERHAAVSFDPHQSRDLIDRKKAVRKLREAATAYHEDAGRAAILHTNKMLAAWSWPQSALYPAELPNLAYSTAQIDLMIAYHFEGNQEALSRLAISRYFTA